MRAYIHGCSESHSMRKIPVGVIKADVDRDDKALYYGCRSDPSDELENADFIGINSYLHCDGSVTSMKELVGYNQLWEDYSTYNITVPVLWTEFGCMNEVSWDLDEAKGETFMVLTSLLMVPLLSHSRNKTAMKLNETFCKWRLCIPKSFGSSLLAVSSLNTLPKRP